MGNLNDLGKVYESDLLIIGGGWAGLVTAIRAMQENPDLDYVAPPEGGNLWFDLFAIPKGWRICQISRLWIPQS